MKAKKRKLSHKCSQCGKRVYHAYARWSDDLMICKACFMEGWRIEPDGILVKYVSKAVTT